MNLSVGIVGLPNVGKSTLFNALLKKQAALAANYPFATIEPNVGVVPVPDERLVRLAEITAQEIASPSARNDSLKLPPIVPATVEFIDIAGLVKGASEGAGLGNKFLSHIREVSVIAHVVRAFEDDNVIREGSVDPKSDYETIRTELILADLSIISKIKDQKSKTQIKNQKEVIERLEKALNEEVPVHELQFSDEEVKFVKQLSLLSAKPEIIVLNISEVEYKDVDIPHLIDKYSILLEIAQTKFIVICAKIESELAELSEEDQKAYLAELGLKTSGLDRLTQKAYETLGLQSFLTAGEKEVRAWTIRSGSRAVEAAGEIHTDFIKNFIKVEIVPFDMFIECGGWKGAREHGKSRMEGRDYVMQEGDVVEFKIGR